MRAMRIDEGIGALADDMLRNLPQLLQFGPIGLIEFDGKNGWSRRYEA